MSHIFDALQRCESERSGIDPASLSCAAQLLEIAERKAHTEQRAPARNIGPKETHNRTPVLVVPAQAPVHAAEELIAPRSANSNELDDQPHRFRCITSALTAESRLISATDPESFAAEKFRYLAVRLQETRNARTLKTVLVTSTIPREGKSMLAGNLACTLAVNTRQKVLLIDGDLRRPTIATMFGLTGVPGLHEYLKGERSLQESVCRLQDLNLCICTAGVASSAPLELLQSGRLPGMILELASWFDWVIIDSAPILPMADTSVWMRLTDGILLAVRPGVTMSRELQKGLEAIDTKRLIGAVSNCSRRPAHGEYYYSSTGSPA